MERTLLLVDDEENILRALVRLFRRDGYTILTANSGEDGLRILQDKAVGVIISDQRMPSMSGVEFLSKVKERYPETMRIVLSGYTELKTVTDAINRGSIYKFLTKPWEDDLIRENIKEAFHRYELVKENERLTEEVSKANALLAENNQLLEQRVQEKTQTLEINLCALKVTQEVLEKLPVAVIGVSDDGVISVANIRAHKMMATNNGVLVGRSVKEVLAPDLIEMMQSHTGPEPLRKRLARANGEADMEAYHCRMGTASGSRGSIVVLLEGSDRNRDVVAD